MGLFDTAGKGAAEEIHKAATDALQMLDPIVRDAEMRIQGIVHDLLDRLDGMTITVNIPPPKAKADNPAPD